MAIVLVGVMLFATSACGGDDSSSSDGTTTEAATTSDGSGSASGTLKGETGPGFTIEVSMDGQDAETVSAGTYTLNVEDKSDMHNFHLIGPGGDEEVTDVSFVGDKSVEVTLEPGTYTYQCDPHAAQGMKGTFTVT
ncbi:MAG: plastocyanin/azurin family copper-binding protein [Actinomycetota bacterium]|nr:plastocyanin/azurin family copper-binding protein [Actinomycetota bacterium]